MTTHAQSEEQKAATHAKAPVVLNANGVEGPVAVMCGGCRTNIWPVGRFGGGANGYLAAFQAALNCCAPRACVECGGFTRIGWPSCAACRTKAERKSLHDAFDKATKVTLENYDGKMVVADDEEQYVYTADWDSDEHPPHVLDSGTCFVWGTRAQTANVDLEAAVEGWLDEHHEDACDWVNYDKLREAQPLIDAALEKVVTYYPNESQAVLVPPPTHPIGLGQNVSKEQEK